MKALDLLQKKDNVYVCFDIFSSKGRKFATVYSTRSLINVIKTKQGRKDLPGCFGLYTYDISMKSSDWQRVKDMPNVQIYEGRANDFIKTYKQ